MRKIITILMILCLVVINSIVLNAETVDDDLILEHQNIYSGIKSEFENNSEYSLDNPYIVMDPYGNSPLTGYIGVKSSEVFNFKIEIVDKNDTNNISFEHSGSNSYFVPLLGLYAGTENIINLQYDFGNGEVINKELDVVTGDLPQDFGQYDIINEENITNNETNKLYFDSVSSSYHSGIDKYGEVRWYNSATDIFGVHFFEELDNGLLVTQNATDDQYIVFDYNGRIYDYYTPGNLIHHDIEVLDGNSLLLTSDDPAPENPQEIYTIEDQLSVVEYGTWNETYNLDFKLMFDENRSPQPYPTPTNEYESDWFHLNSSTYNEEQNEYISSGRQQNIIVATDANFIQTGVEDTSGINWILGSPQTWENEDVYGKFLTPVDDLGNDLYDLTDPIDIENANREFFNWGQHSMNVVNFDDDPNTTELLIFNDGNFKSYNSDYFVGPDINTSKMSYYKINISDKTVQLVNEFGTELGNEYYSSYVGSVEYQEDSDSIVINFGGVNIDEKNNINVGIPGDAPITEYPDYDYDINQENIQEKTRVVEIDRQTNEIIFAYDHYTNVKGNYKNSTFKVKTHVLDNNY